MHVLNFCETLHNKTPSQVLHAYRLLGKSFRQISRYRYVLSSHNEKIIFANRCEITPSPLRKILQIFESVPYDAGIKPWNFCAMLCIFRWERAVFLKTTPQKIDTRFTTLNILLRMFKKHSCEISKENVQIISLRG